MTLPGGTSRHLVAALALVAGLLGGCRDADYRMREDAEAARWRPVGAPRRVMAIQGFHDPESVRYDRELDVFYVSNMYMFGSEKDGNGFITRIEAGDPRRGSILARGGERGVVLHAPKGMAVQGDTLWVADIDVLRGFHRVTGAPVGTIDFAAHRPTLLNDVAVGPDGSIRVTDTGIVMSRWGVVYDTTGDRVFTVGRGRTVTATPAAEYPKPNGITWDAVGKRWLVVTFGAFASGLYAVGDTAGIDSTAARLAEGKGQWDGVEALDDGRILFSSWTDSSIHVVDGPEHHQLVRGVPEPADIGVDTRRGRLAIPLSVSNRVELWTIPRRR
jgi:hypothetical protein